MLSIIPYLIPIVGRPRFANSITTKADPSLLPTTNEGLVESTSFYIFCVVAFSIMLESRKISRNLTSNNAHHIRIALLNPVLLLKSGMTVVAVTPSLVRFDMLAKPRFLATSIFFIWSYDRTTSISRSSETKEWGPQCISRQCAT